MHIIIKAHNFTIETIELHSRIEMIFWRCDGGKHLKKETLIMNSNSSD